MRESALCVHGDSHRLSPRRALPVHAYVYRARSNRQARLSIRILGMQIHLRIDGRICVCVCVCVSGAHANREGERELIHAYKRTSHCPRIVRNAHHFHSPYAVRQMSTLEVCRARVNGECSLDTRPNYLPTYPLSRTERVSLPINTLINYPCPCARALGCPVMRTRDDNTGR